jgi:hypothetical protein
MVKRLSCLPSSLDLIEQAARVRLLVGVCKVRQLCFEFFFQRGSGLAGDKDLQRQLWRNTDFIETF